MTAADDYEVFLHLAIRILSFPHPFNGFGAKNPLFFRFLYPVKACFVENPVESVDYCLYSSLPLQLQFYHKKVILMLSNFRKEAAMQLTNPSVIKELLTRHGFSFSKALGQNFIINPGICPRMAEEGGAAPGVGVLEIGPGFGVLTAELARRADKVVAIEIDDRLPPILAETLAEFDNVTILSGDAMELDLHAVIAEHFPGMEVVVCANLPYYITSPLVMRLLEQDLPLTAITVMVQKEAAQRIVSPPGSRLCGAISAAVWYYSTPRQLFGVSRGSFMPAPEVDSAVMRLDINKTPPIDVPDRRDYFKVVKAAFSQRRKTLLNSLSSGLSLSKDAVRAILSEAEIAENTRAEQLSLQQFGALAAAYTRQKA